MDQRQFVALVTNNVHLPGKKVVEYYGRWYGRIVFHFLPKYAPDLNPIERVWWHLREEITRNHPCKKMEPSKRSRRGPALPAQWACIYHR